MKKSFKNNWKNVLSIVLVVVLLVGAVSAVVAVTSVKTKDISPLAFSVGAVDANGIHSDSDLSIYTKDLIECQGLVIEPDFEATGTYQVFYYAADKTFLGATREFEASAGSYTKGEDDFLLAKYCRIVITPAVPVDEDGDTVEDFKINFYEAAGYAGAYKITVNKKQSFRYDLDDNLVTTELIFDGHTYNVSSSDASAWNLNNNTTATGSKILVEPIEIPNKSDFIEVYVKAEAGVTGTAYALIADEDGNVVEHLSIDVSDAEAYTYGEWYRMVFNLDSIEGEEFVSVMVPSNASVQVFAYSN